VASAVERDKSEGFECKEQTAKAAAVAGSLIGKLYGERAYGAAGAALGGGIGGPSGAFIGREVGEMYGRELGPVHGYIVGEAIGTVAGEYICGDSKPEPTPLPSPDPVVPADSTPVPAVSPTPTEAPEVPPLSDTDAPEKPADVGNPEDVGRRTDEWMDETDPTDREPKPGDTPRNHVARVRNERYLPDEYIDRASRMPNPNQLSFHGLPRRVTLNDGTVVDWGPMAPYILYTADNPGSTRKCIREIMRAVPFTPDPRFPGRERLDPTVVNPVRDAFSTQQMVRDIVERAKRRT
jgi:hypothetical protein